MTHVYRNSVIFRHSKLCGLAAERGFEISNGDFNSEFAKLTDQRSCLKHLTKATYQCMNN